MKDYIALTRPLQWAKNIFVFAPIFFSNHLFDIKALIPALYAFFAFCFVSSAIYCLNDIIDVEADRKHPEKCHRPIASGKVSLRCAWILFFLCCIVSFLIMCLSQELNGNVIGIIGLYLVLNIAYCFYLKQKAVLDVSIISVGFVLRVLAGSFATGIEASAWLILMTFLLALFLALTKRRNDFHIFVEKGIKPRKSITGYNAQFIDLSIVIAASVTMVCYIMYTMDDSVTSRFDTKYLYLTSFFVLAGLLRYLQNMLVYERSGNPSDLFIHDHFIHLCVIGWLVVFFFIIYM